MHFPLVFFHHTILAMTSSLLCLRQRLLQQHAKTYGTLLLSDSPVVAELLAGMGYGHIIIDHEHSPTHIGGSSHLSMLQGLDAANYHRSRQQQQQDSQPLLVEPIIRMPGPSKDPSYMKQVLDSVRLPGGVLVPMVEDADTAQAIVDSIRYPKQQNQNSSSSKGGVRGCAVPFVRASGWGTMGTSTSRSVSDNSATYMHQCEEELLVMVQVETPQAVEKIPEIAAVEGIDMIFLGPMDLSCSIGKMGQFDDAEVQTLLKTAEQAVRDSPDCLLGGFRPPGRDLKEMFDDAGYSLVTGSVDMGLLREAARVDVNGASDFV